MSEPQPAAQEPATNDPLGRLLAASLAARPEAKPIPNLAQRAIERARMLDRLTDQQRRSLAIHRWRLRFVYAAAVLLIGVLVLLGGRRLLSERQSISSTDDSIAELSAGDSTTPSTSTYVLWLGGLLFICTLAGLATESAIAPDRSSVLV